MAGFALYRRMPSLEQIVREFMLESLAIEHGDLGVPADVIGMADLAWLALDLRGAAMKSERAVDIGVHLDMAFEAKRRLRALLEGRMAAVARRLELRVPLDEFARHDELFEDRLTECERYPRRCQKANEEECGGESMSCDRGHQSIQVNCNDVDDDRADENNEQRHVQHMP